VRFEDVRAIDETTWGVDLICGGFPCQDISDAGKKAGIEGAKSGLWFEYARIIRLLRPRVVVIENVAALARRGLDRVLGELAAAGYNAEWTTLCANDVGAPHERARLFVVAYAASEGLEGVLDTELQRALRRTEGDLRRHWATAPNVALVADGLPRGMAKPRVKALGNAVVPQCAEVLGRAIVAALH
jgi:DNA (cytosine-5)-methyltransferase 1